MSKPFTPRRESRRGGGFTLLEVLLALGLSIAVISAIGYAIFFHMRVLDSQRQRVEQSLVARGMLNLMANDIRAAVQYKLVDVSQLEALLGSVDLASLLASSAGEDMLSSAMGEGGLDAAALGEGLLGGDAVAGDGAAGDPATEATEGPRPGLYGTSTELEVDISRMPRRDQYLYGMQTLAADYPSDLRTVYYRLVPTETLNSQTAQGVSQPAAAASLSSDAGTGLSLVRSTISQAVRRYEESAGNSSEFFGETEVLADEVSSLQFRYYDGAQAAWLDEWDTDEMESLPTAVEITVEFQFRPIGFADSTAAMDQMATDSYRLVVHLPLAEPPADEGDSGDTSGGAASSGASGGMADMEGGN